MKETKTEDKLYMLNTHYKTEVNDVELSQCISDTTAEVETSTVDSCIAGKDITVEHLSQVTITSQTATPAEKEKEDKPKKRRRKERIVEIP